MSSIEQEEPRSTQSAICTPQPQGAFFKTDVEETGKPEPIYAAPLSGKCCFYFGLVVTLGGSVAFLVGAFSNKWIVVIGEVKTTQIHPERLLAHLGPWQACNQAGHCAEPWNIAPGLGEEDRTSFQGLQAFVGLSALTYIIGVVFIILRLPGLGLANYAGSRKLVSKAVLEYLVPLAAILAFLSILLMGLLKNRLIIHQDQTAQPGWAFVVCLPGVMATVVGSIFRTCCRQTVTMETTSFLDVILRAIGRDFRKETEAEMMAKSSRMRNSGCEMFGLPTSVNDSDVHIAEVDAGIFDDKIRRGGGGKGAATAATSRGDGGGEMREEAQGQELAGDANCANGEHVEDYRSLCYNRAAVEDSNQGEDVVVVLHHSADVYHVEGDNLPGKGLDNQVSSLKGATTIEPKIAIESNERENPKDTTRGGNLDDNNFKFQGQELPPTSPVLARETSSSNTSHTKGKMRRGDKYSGDIARPRPLPSRTAANHSANPLLLDEFNNQ